MARIVFFVSSMNGGGAERVAALLCNRWAQLGHEVYLIPTYSGRGGCIYSLDPRVNLIFLADRLGSVEKNIKNIFKRLLLIRRIVNELMPSLIISFLATVNIMVVLAMVGINIPLYVSERTYPGSKNMGFILRLLRKFTYGRATKVVIQTQEGRDWLDRFIPRANSVVVGNPVSLPLVQNEPIVCPMRYIPQHHNVIICVGRLTKVKQFELVIKAFAILSKTNPSWHLAILGEGLERNGLEILVSSLGLQSKVHLPGRVGNIGTWYDRADVFVMSSKYEGFPNALLEALASGLPSVSFNCQTGPKDLIVDGINGYLLEERTGSAGLANSLLLLLKDKARRTSFSINARRLARENSLENIGDKWDTVIGLTNNRNSNK